MLLQAILLAIGIVGLVLTWNQIKKWLIAIVDEVHKKLKDIIHAADVFIQKITKEKNKSYIKYKLYHKEKNGEWIEETTSKEVYNSELPHILKERIEFKEENLEKSDFKEMTTKKIPVSETPQFVKEKFKANAVENEEILITPEIEKELKLTL